MSLANPSKVAIVAGLTLTLGLATAGEGPTGDPTDIAAGTAGFDAGDYADLVIGVPGESVTTFAFEGAINVIYGSGAGLTATNNQFWHQDTPGILGDAGAGEQFGGSLTVGDFNGDGLADVAVGIPFEFVTSEGNGGVQVLYGAPGGLSSGQDQLWSQNSPNVLDVSEINDHFGWAVAAGDFDGDGFDDLAVGVPDEDFGSATEAGAVNILYGSAAWLSSDGNMILHQDIAGTANAVESGDKFGIALSTGDFDADGFDDLAVGVSGEDNGSIENSGAVHVFYGSAGGIDPEDDWFIHQNMPDMLDQTEPSDRFGNSVASGDFNGDGFDDLAIGVENEDVDAVFNAGAVQVVYGSADGLTATGNQFWHQNVPGTASTAGYFDLFGASLAAGDFDDDGYTDLAVGVSGDSDGAANASGAVHVFYGAPGGLGITGNWFFNQDTTGMQDAAEGGDLFGFSLTVGGFNGDAYADLAIGIPYEDLGLVENCGAVSVVLGSSSGLTTDGNQLWHQDSPDILDESGLNELFGSAVAALPPTGLFLDDFETGGTVRWAVSVP